MLRYCKIIYNYSSLFINLFTIYNRSIDIKNNEKWIDKLITNISSTGPVSIKFIQWLLPITKIIYPDLLITEKFNIFFEKCNIHNIEYTEKIYKKNYKSELLDDYNIIDLIGSGSIGQVYLIEDKINKDRFAMKVTHPDITFQINVFLIIYKLITKYINLSLILPNVDIDKFVYSLKDQTNLEIEANNCDLFSKLYSDIDCIVIPKIKSKFKDIFIMEYLPGIKIYNEKVNNITRCKVLTTLAIFIENSCINEISHGDLHEGNWSIIDFNTDMPKIIIYDFGFCFRVENDEYFNAVSLLTRNNKLEDIKPFLNYYLKKSYNSKLDKEYILKNYKKDPLFDNDIINSECVSLLALIPALIKFLLKNNIKITDTCLNSLVLFLQLCGYFAGTKLTGGDGVETGVYDYHEYTINIISLLNKYNICKKLKNEKEKETLNHISKFNNDFDKFKNLKKFL